MELTVRRLASFALAAAILLAGAGCSDLLPDEPDTRNPEWLDALIAQVELEEVTEPPTAIYGYRYHGETVYYRTARCCDIRSIVYGAEGSVICEPTGGIGGDGDPRCPDFLETRSEERLIFQDPRT
jgi:Domain of unknown function (DUF6970)